VQLYCVLIRSSSIFAFPLMSSEALVSVAETPVNAGRFTPPENTTERVRIVQIQKQV